MSFTLSIYISHVTCLDRLDHIDKRPKDVVDKLTADEVYLLFLIFDEVSGSLDGFITTTNLKTDTVITDMDFTTQMTLISRDDDLDVLVAQRLCMFSRIVIDSIVLTVTIEVIYRISE